MYKSTMCELDLGVKLHVITKSIVISSPTYIIDVGIDIICKNIHQTHINTNNKMYCDLWSFLFIIPEFIFIIIIIDIFDVIKIRNKKHNQLYNLN